MPSELMNLEIWLPFELFAERSDVLLIVAETRSGSFGFLPRRSDCAVALHAGVLIYEIEGGEEEFVAVDGGMIVKSGPDVLVMVRQAMWGTDLSHLWRTVDREFLQRSDREQHIGAVLTRMESRFVARLVRLHLG